VVITTDATGWVGPRPYFDASVGVGVRFNLTSAAGPPVWRFLRSLF
jgi:hypothetical protein